MCSLPNGRVVWFLSTGPWFLTWPQREEMTCPSSLSYSEGSMTFKAGIHQASLGNIVSESLSQRKNGKKREEEERGSRLGIKCICLAVGACFPLYLSSGSLRVSPYMAPHYGLIWGSHALLNKWHGAWPVWMPSKYSKGQARQCFSSRWPSLGSHILPVLCDSNARNVKVTL